MKTILIAALALLLIGFTAAENCPPSIPMTFEGEVYYNDSILSGDYKISAKIGDNNLGIIGEVINGLYLIDISSCTDSSEKIIFYINGIEANEKYNFAIAKYINLDLTLEELPPSSNPCGNKIIDLGEECDLTNLGGRTCGENWKGKISCTSKCKIDYSNCEVIIPDNNANDNNNRNPGGGSNANTGTRNFPNIQNNNSDNLIALDNPQNTEQNLSNKNSPKPNTAITGGIIGTLGIPGIIIISIFIIVIIAGFLVVMIKKKF